MPDKKTDRFIFLHSVMTALDPKTMVTHPMLTGGGVDLYEGMAVHITDVCDRWIEALSTKDRYTLTSEIHQEVVRGLKAYRGIIEKIKGE